MGFVKVSGLIGRSRDRLREVTFLADPGSFYTLLTPSLARELGISPTLTTQVVLADSRTVEIGLTVAYLRLGDREGGVPVGVMDVPSPLLGVSALEALGLKVNPVEGVLQKTRPFGPAVLTGGCREPGFPATFHP
jgi:predicted aspartyl protease